MRLTRSSMRSDRTSNLRTGRKRMEKADVDRVSPCVCRAECGGVWATFPSIGSAKLHGEADVPRRAAVTARVRRTMRSYGTLLQTHGRLSAMQALHRRHRRRGIIPRGIRPIRNWYPPILGRQRPPCPRLHRRPYARRRSRALNIIDHIRRRTLHRTRQDRHRRAYLSSLSP